MTIPNEPAALQLVEAMGQEVSDYWEEEDCEQAPDSQQLAENPLDSYRPFIGDVPLSAHAEPFPLPEVVDGLSAADLERKKKILRKRLKGHSFNPPIPLADFCLVAPDRWERESDSANGCMGCTKI
jgi:hypothetical protein